MASISLPTTGSPNWGEPLNTAINAINDEVILTTSTLTGGRLSPASVETTIDSRIGTLSGLPGISPLINLGNKTGALDLSPYRIGQFARVTMTGSLTVAASGRPIVPADTAGSFVLRLQQDSTGGRSFVAEGMRTAYGLPTQIATQPNAVSIVSLVWSGAEWWLIDTAPLGIVPVGW